MFRNKINAPDGYPFFVDAQNSSSDSAFPVQRVKIGCKSLSDSLAYWKDILGMQIVSKSGDTGAVLRFGEGQAELELKEESKQIEHGSAFGRIAFAVPAKDLPDIEKRMKEAGRKILTPWTKLDTPGKATVEVVILADPVNT